MEELISKIVDVLPEEGVKELDAMLDGEVSEQQLKDFLEKYNIDLKKIAEEKEAA